MSAPDLPPLDLLPPDLLSPDLLLNEAAQVRAAGNPATAPEVLRALAAAASPTVRAAVAMNAATPESVDRLLAEDDHEPVRALLARKLAMLVPRLPASDRGRLQTQAYQTLARLVTDEAARVRGMIAEIVREMPEAPHELILWLAHDVEFAIADPVIRLSPLLTAADLLGLLGRPQSPGAVAIASRKGLDAAVAEVIARSDNAAAIAVLLENHSAVIREATLDALVQRAGGQPGWHRPLIRRPGLSSRAARALSEIVTLQMLGELARRGDLAPTLREEVRRRLAQRRALQDFEQPEELSPGEAMAAARGAHRCGKLDEAALLAALRRGDAVMCAAILAVRAGLPQAAVERAAGLRSAKGLVSLIWAAGFSMRVAESVQLSLGQLTPNLLLHADAAGSFPLSAEEMRWQIELLSHTGRPSRAGDANVSVSQAVAN